MPLSSHPTKPKTRTAALISLGCSKNLADSEDLVTALRSVDFRLTDRLPEADLVLINTCGFIEGAKQESIQHILDAAEGRKPGAKLFVAGCLTERYLAELQADMPEVDRWVVFKDYDRFPAVVREHFPDAPDHRLRHDQRSQLTPPHFAFLKIAEGCDNTCNFCAIPTFRGKHKSRPQDELITQARTLAGRGVKEINLISQHLDYYGQDLYGERRLPQLVRAVAAAAPESWIRLHYCYPNDFTDELIAAMAETANVVKYVDMPIQHASDRTLAQMGRRTTRAQISERLDRIRAAMPTVVLRTTFIVGFPGERDEDFRELMEFAAEQRFDSVGCFPYSDEDGTTAAKMPKKLDAEVIAARHHAFMTQQKRLHRARLKRWIGGEQMLLVDAQRDFGSFTARHFGQAHEVDGVTTLTAERAEVGGWVKARITAAKGYDLIAEAV
ncbi:MAG TPA: 30S ribosomal protein S12 methylthiotransferase RimO [Planctomycetota bacterium]|nr:30S ribosomal protein S12 methylthiotransferase RimO [Planctomycetota bacterium]